MKAASFNIKDLCRIMEVGANAGVAELKFGDLTITFRQDASQGVHIITRPEPVSPKVLAQQKENQKEFDDQTKDVIERFSAAQLLVEDPLAHEEEMIEQLMGRPRLNDQAEED